MIRTAAKDHKVVGCFQGFQIKTKIVFESIEYMREGVLCQGKSPNASSANLFDRREQVNPIDLPSVFQYSGISFHSFFQSI